MLKVCIIGATGHAGYVINAAKTSKDFYISAVADGAERMGCEKTFNGARETNGDAKKYDNYIEMLEAEKPDIAVVNPFCGYNAQVNIECLKRKINVFSEKPVATTMEDLNALKSAYNDSGVLFSSMMAIRYQPWFQATKKAIDSGAVGEIRLMNAQKSYRFGNRDLMYPDRKLYGGTIPWVGSHAIDWIYWVSGKKFEEVYALQSTIGNHGKGELEVSATCNFKMEDEICATVTLDLLRPAAAPTHDDDRLRVVGTKGVLEIRGGQVYLTDSRGESMIELGEKKNIFDDYIDCLLKRPNQTVSAEDAFYVTEACIRARMSADENKAIKF